jgi:hypothetical protein
VGLAPWWRRPEAWATSVKVETFWPPPRMMVPENLLHRVPEDLRSPGRDRVIQKQERQIAKLEKELRISKALIELQKKAHEILGIALPRVKDATEDGSSSSSNSSSWGSRAAAGPRCRYVPS